MEPRKKGKTCHFREDLLRSHGMKQMQARESKDGLRNFLALWNVTKQELNKVDNLFRSTSYVYDNPNSNKKKCIFLTSDLKMTLKFSGIGLIISGNPYHSSLPAALTWRSTTDGKMHQNLWPSKKTTAANILMWDSKVISLCSFASSQLLTQFISLCHSSASPLSTAPCCTWFQSSHPNSKTLLLTGKSSRAHTHERRFHAMKMTVVNKINKIKLCNYTRDTDSKGYKDIAR